jgi:prefoldin subunit 5
MSRLSKWLPFFEESSERRDVESWQKCLRENILDKYSKYFELNSIKIVGIVSDRAKALVKLGSTAYLNVCSMPDLFHFMQDIGSLGGLQIGKKYKKACIEKSILKPKKEKLSELEQDIIKNADEIIEVYQEYRQETRSINQTIHPFNDLNEWRIPEITKKNILQSICKIGRLSEKLDIRVNIAKATKIMNQIPDIVKGIDNWVKNNRKKINDWVVDKVITTVEKIWFESFLLPTVY